MRPSGGVRMGNSFDKKQPASNEDRALKIIGTGGYSCFTGWFLLSVFDALPRYSSDPSTWLALLPSIMLFSGMALFTIALHVFADEFERSHLNITTVACATALCCLLSTYPMLPHADSLLSFIPLNALALIAGCSSIYFFFSWDDFGGRSKTGSYVKYLATSLCAGNVLFLFGVLSMSPEARCLLALGLIILSGFLLSTINELSALPKKIDESEDVDGKTGSSIPLDKRISILFSVFGIAFGLAWANLLQENIDNLFWAFVISGIAEIALVTRARKDAVIHDHYVVTLIRACIVVLGVSFLCLASFGSEVSLPALCIICASWQLFWIIDASLLMRHVAKYDFSIPRHTAMGRMGSNLGFAIGIALGVAGNTLLGQSATALLGVVMTATLVVSSMIFFPFENRKSPDKPMLDRNSTEEPAPNPIPPNLEEACEKLTKTYGLSQREEEILPFIVKGRNNRFIAETLYISENTAKTHVYNIYKKMGVHSRQQVLDIVDMIG